MSRDITSPPGIDHTGAGHSLNESSINAVYRIDSSPRYAIKCYCIKYNSFEGDTVHDIAFDYYGRRFASCSSDRHIKVAFSG